MGPGGQSARRSWGGLWLCKRQFWGNSQAQAPCPAGTVFSLEPFGTSACDSSELTVASPGIGPWDEPRQEGWVCTAAAWHVPARRRKGWVTLQSSGLALWTSRMITLLNDLDLTVDIAVGRGLQKADFISEQLFCRLFHLPYFIYLPKILHGEEFAMTFSSGAISKVSWIIPLSS